jgi:hypothetical protein
MGILSLSLLGLGLIYKLLDFSLHPATRGVDAADRRTQLPGNLRLIAAKQCGALECQPGGFRENRFSFFGGEDDKLPSVFLLPHVRGGRDPGVLLPLRPPILAYNRRGFLLFEQIAQPWMDQAEHPTAKRAGAWIDLKPFGGRRDGLKNALSKVRGLAILKPMATRQPIDHWRIEGNKFAPGRRVLGIAQPHHHTRSLRCGLRHGSQPRKKRLMLV